MKPTAWRRLGKYVLLGRLGAGGMGKIYLAHAPGPAGIDKLLIVKRLHGHLTGDPVLVTSFLDEARLSMALNHPHIVHTYDVGELDGRYFMVMEYIDGQNLGVLLRTAKRSGQYPPSRLWAGLFSGVLEGLHAAHVARDARGRPLQIIHRDVSPQNVLVTYEGTPKLVDFGIAKAAMRVGETDAGTLKGKYAYMSPEQVRGEPLDPRSDVFAAGVVLWEMLAGRRLYKADTIVRSVERILKEEPVSPQRVNPDVDERLAAVCTKALDKVRERRFASAEAMKEALEDALVAMGHRHRAVDVRELMQRLFSDVIDKQRAMLEATLNATGEVAEIDDDDPRPRRTADSQSDLRMRQLHVAAAVDHETTTPSALRRSPLVTEEDAARAVEPSALPSPAPVDVDTAVGRQRRRLSPLLPPDPPSPRAVTLPPRPPAELRVVAELSAPVTATQSAAGLVDAPSPPLSSPSSPSGRRWLLPAVGLGSGVAAVVALVIGGGAAPPSPAPPGLVTTAAGGASVIASGPRPGDVVRPPVASVPAPSSAVDVVRPPVASVPAPSSAVDVVADAGAGDESPGGLPTSSLSAPSLSAPSLSAPSLRRPPPRRPAPPKRPAVEPPTETAVVVADGGFLTLDTVPWTTVYLGRKKLGETPLVKVPVPSGELELSLVNGDAKINESYVARVKPGEVVRKRLDLR
ncbi:MAG: serine/threonine protein kinase [Deltaproteobacteria bacterium]|nr:serine/threonine protein kinase [Deltaproteobacteria bacterium]